jgi:hypothetical protein
MTKEIITAGISETAPVSAPATAEKSTVMVLAVHRDAAGEIVLTPIDVAHDTDDLRGMSSEEMARRKDLDKTYVEHEGAMKKALGALFEIFDGRLYRTQFRTFENFCFAFYGTHRITEVTALKAKAKAKKLQAELEATV